MPAETPITAAALRAAARVAEQERRKVALHPRTMHLIAAELDRLQEQIRREQENTRTARRHYELARRDAGFLP